MNIEPFREELRALINRHNLENGSSTPDHILADYLVDCLLNYERAVIARADGED